MPKKMDVNTKAEAARAHQGGGLLAGGREPQVPLRALPQRGCREARRRGCPPRRARAALARRRRAAPYRMAARVGGPVVPKVTEPGLLRRREEERLRLEREAETAKKRQARKADEEEYERVVLVANTNRDDSIIEARSVEDAIAKMSIAAEPALPPDRHPERRLKVSYKAFEEADLAKLKEEKPVLTLHQYKDMIWKHWKKFPDNPLNQVAD